MFSRSPRAPQRKSFTLTQSQIIQDVEAVSCDQEERNKLFACLDDKIPRDKRYAEMEAFLKGTQKLEELAQRLRDQVQTLQTLAEGLTSSIDEIENRLEACQ